MNLPCPNVIPCPGTDNPFANLSSEGPDYLYYKRVYFAGDLGPGNTPPLGSSYSKLACAKVYNSTVSQEDADQQAAIAAEMCVTYGITDPSGGGVTTYFNGEQSCAVYCPDGGIFTYTIGAGKFSDRSQDAANRKAYSEACTQAQRHRICLSDITPSICQNVAGSVIITANFSSAPTGPISWSLEIGSVPTGMTFNAAGSTTTHAAITGTPSVVGSYSFSIRCTDVDGNYMVKPYTLIVAGITNTLPLTNATVGTPYGPVQLTVIGYQLPVFAIDSGALPNGLSLSGAGIISGTPTVSATFNFTVLIEENG